jgi:hypothetical protein
MAMEKRVWSQSELQSLKDAVAAQDAAAAIEKNSWRDSLQPWLPAVFCAFLCFSVRETMVAFWSFLPMCFVFATLPMTSMRREIAELRSRLEKVERR